MSWFSKKSTSNLAVQPVNFAFKSETILIEEAEDNGTPAVDFKAMNAFSIERVYIPKRNRVATLIGYIFNNEIREWVIYCSLENHEVLVVQFEDYVSGKYDPIPSTVPQPKN